MVASINLATVRANFIADVRQFESGIRRMERVQGSLGGQLRRVDQQQQRYNKTAQQFTQSIRSNIIATAAYTVGIEGLRALTTGVVSAYTDWDRQLIAVAKTTGLNRQETQQLSREFERLLTRASALGGPLPVMASDLLRIAEVAGQMRIQGVRDIAAFTETVALLTLTTDLSGDAAANALGKIISLTSATADESLQLGSAITALGNQFRGGEREIIAQAQSIAAATSQYELSARTLLGLSAVFSQSGIQAEATGTVIQRVLQNLANATKAQVTLIANAARISREELDELIATGDRQGQLVAFVRALSSLPETVSAGSAELTRAGFLESIFGESNVRITRVLGVLSRDFGELQRALAVSNDEFDRQRALTEEAEQAAASYSKRLATVFNQLKGQARDLGGSVVPQLTTIAEQFRVIETVALTAGAAFASNFLFRAPAPGRRPGLARSAFAGAARNVIDRSQARDRIERAQRRARDAQNAARAASANALALNVPGQAAARSRLTAQASSAAQQSFIVASPVGRRFARQSQDASGRAFAAQAAAAQASQRATAAAERTSRRAGAVVAGLTRRFSVGAATARVFGGALAFLGGPVGAVFTGITALLAVVTLFPNAASSAAEGTLEFFRSLSSSDSARAALNLAAQARSAEELRDAIETLRAAEEGIGQGGARGGRSGQVARQRALADIRERREEIVQTLALAGDEQALRATEAELAKLQAQVDARPTEFRGRGRARQRVRDDEGDVLRGERDRLQGLVEAARAAATTVPDTIGDLAERVGLELRPLYEVFDEGSVAAREFFDGLRQGADADLRAALFDLAQLTQAGGPQTVQRIAFDQQAQVQARVAALRDERGRVSGQLSTARQELANLEAALADAGQADTETGSAAVAQLEERVGDVRDVVEELEERANAVTRELLATGGGDDRPSPVPAALASLRAQVAEADRAAALSRQEGVDPAEARVILLEIERGLHERIFKLQVERTAEQLRASGVDAERIAAFQLTNDLELERRAILDQQVIAQGRIADIRREVAALDVPGRLDESVLVSDDDVARYQTLVDELAEAETESEQLALGLQTISDADLQGLIAQIAELTQELRIPGALIAEAARNLLLFDENGRESLTGLKIAFEELTLSGIGRFGDELALLVTQGRGEFRELANSIVRDLVRIAFQAVVTQNIIRALNLALGLSGSNLPANAGVPLSAGIAPFVAHDGGRVGSLPPFLHSRLARNERVTVLKLGEEVLTARDPRHVDNIGRWVNGLPKFHEGGVLGGGGGAGRRESRMYFEVLNQGSGPPQQVTDVRQEVRGDKYITQVVLGDLGQRGPIRKAFEGLIRATR